MTRTLAALLLGLFLSMHLLQVFHSHSDCASVEHSSQEEQYASTIEKCHICDYLAHHRHEVYYLTELIKLPVHFPIHIEPNDFLSFGTYKFIPQSHYNRGPPIAC